MRPIGAAMLPTACHVTSADRMAYCGWYQRLRDSKIETGANYQIRTGRLIRTGSVRGSRKPRPVYYYSQNLLAGGLNEQVYRLNPGFKCFVEQSGLPFAPQSEFKKANLDSRQGLYELLAEMFWELEVMARIKEGSDY